MENGVKMENWGKDHWSTFAYVETLCVDGIGGVGIPDKNKLRCDPTRHLGLIGPINNSMGIYDIGKRYPTRLKDGELDNHDDWDCIDDMEEHGLIKIMGTGIHPTYLLTKTGSILAHELRVHKTNGGNFSNFTPTTTCKQMSRLQMAEDSEINVNLMLGKATTDMLDKSRGYTRKESMHAGQ